tara:strand:- start:322 stop:615 length:294 start_codon:yes stop_codon:yes gene_type:complete
MTATGQNSFCPPPPGVAKNIDWAFKAPSASDSSSRWRPDIAFRRTITRFASIRATAPEAEFRRIALSTIAAKHMSEGCFSACHIVTETIKAYMEAKF